MRANAPNSIRSPQGIKFFTGQLANSLAGDLEGFADQINAINIKLQKPQQVTSILLTNEAGQVISGVGNLVYRGVRYTNFFSELHVGNSLLNQDPTKALFNANADGSVSIGGAGWLDIHDPYDGNAAWVGTQFDTLAITGATNANGTIRLTIPGHTLITGNTAQVRNMQFAGVPNATGIWTVTVVDANTVDLNASVWAGQFVLPPAPAGIDTQSPTIDRVLQITNATSSSGILIQTSIPHDYVTGDRVNIPAVPGVPNATGQWTITVTNATHFRLNGSTFAGAYTGPGTCLRFFAGLLAQQFAVGPSFQNYLLRGFADGSLKLRNASIVLQSGPNSIVLDPNGPSIVASSATSSIVLNASVPNLVFTSPSGSVNINGSNARMTFSSSAGSITIDAILGQITIRNGANTTVASLNTAGDFTAQSISTPGGVTATVLPTFSSMDFTNGILTNFVP